MSSLRSVIITLPKGMQKTTVTNPTNSIMKASNNRQQFNTSILANKIAKMNARKMQKMHLELPTETTSCDSEIITPNVWMRGKKRRLDHLTWEEKLQRKKLKNRVAAQTSRDRKKAKLDELEDTVNALLEKNTFLTQECAMLRAQNESLIAESKRWRKERDENSIDERYCSMCRGRVGCAASTLGSAVSPINPLPQGGATQLAPSPMQTASAAILLKILTLYLLWMNSLAISNVTITSNDSKNLQKVFCAKLPLKWKQLLRDQVNKSSSRKIPLKNLMIRREWWGRHQKMWKPVQPVEA